MKLFRDTKEAALGFIIDIGSASVLVAIVRSDASRSSPDIIWSHREHIPLRAGSASSQGAKNINTALLNAAMLLETTGRKVLDQALPRHSEPAYLQVTIAAPWSYTVTTSISYVKDEPFTVDDELVRELERAAQQKNEEELKENAVMVELGLQVITRATVEKVANGYPIEVVNNQRAVSLQVSHVGAIAQEYVMSALSEIHTKSFPRSRLCVSSFMLFYHHITRDLYRGVQEYCLVDITYEATEIGVVRDGVLRYCTHIPYGAFSLARDIAAVRDLPLEEAYGKISSSNVFTAESSTGDDELYQGIYRAYEEKLAELLRETGDELAIPKTLVMHCGIELEAFFKERVVAAGKLATRGNHIVLMASSDVVATYYAGDKKKNAVVRNDTAMLITAQFFHTHRDLADFEWR